MKITAKASGGFAGRTECYELDTSCGANGKSVEALLHKLDFFGAAAPPCGIGADIPRWEITVDDGPRRHTVRLTEDSLAATEWPALLAHLRKA
jgi:hypothetical protein